MLPPRPPEVAARIVGDVCCRLDEDFAELRSGLAEDVQARDYWQPLIDAERLATGAVRDRWQSIEDACARALAETHEASLVQAAFVAEAIADLAEHGGASWIARAVIHDRGCALAWQVLDDLDLLEELPESRDR
jgi:hypothetical protein